MLHRRATRAALATLLGIGLASVATVRAAPAPRTEGAATATSIAPAVRMPGLRSFTVAATGDVLTEDAVLRAGQAAAAGTSARYDFGPVFSKVAPILTSARLAICHMEIPIGQPGVRAGVYGRSPYGGNLLLAPYEIATGLRAAGYDRCTTSSNHSNDLGTPGIGTTLDALDAVGLNHVGTARTPAESATVLFDVNGVRVAHLAYTNYSNTNLPGASWQLNYTTSPQRVIADVDAARAAGAEVVIVSMHLSQELQREPTPDDRAFMTAVTAGAHVDLVIEHGPHVIQPIEQVNGTWIYWSVGNFISGMGMPGATRYGPDTLGGLIAWARIDEVAPEQFTVTPSSVLICNEIAGRVVYPALTTLRDPAIGAALSAQLQACAGRAASLVPNAF